MKKRLPFIFVLLILLCSVGLIIYNRVSINTGNNNQLKDPAIEANDSNSNTIDVNPSLSSTPENVEKEKLELQEEKEISKNNDVPAIKEETSKKQETTTNQKVNETTNNTNDSSSNTSSNNNSSNIIENKVEEPKSNENVEIIIPEGDNSLDDDPEYKRLKSLIKYKDDMECYYASFDVSLEYNDDENFQVVTCDSFAYKGKLLGYRMAVHYWDGTVIYLDAID